MHEAAAISKLVIPSGESCEERAVGWQHRCCKGKQIARACGARNDKL
jgi:hypothetical protein